MANFSLFCAPFLPFTIFGLLFFMDRCHSTHLSGLSMTSMNNVANSGIRSQLANSSPNGAAPLHVVGHMNSLGRSRNVLPVAKGLKTIEPLNGVYRAPIQPINAFSKNSLQMENDTDVMEKEDLASLDLLRKKLELEFSKELYGENGAKDQQKEEWLNLRATFKQFPVNSQKEIIKLANPTHIALKMLSKLSALKTKFHRELPKTKQLNKQLGIAHMQILDGPDNEYIAEMMDIFDVAYKQYYTHSDKSRKNLIMKMSTVAKIFDEAAKFYELFIKKESLNYSHHHIGNGIQNKAAIAVLMARKEQMENIHKWLEDKVIKYTKNVEDNHKAETIFVMVIKGENTPIPFHK